MSHKLSLVCLLAIAAFALPAVADAASFYVDNTVASSGNGTSWTSAWKNFSNIDWSNIKPGDTLYISGGTTSQTYYESLTVGASGTAGNPITITRGIDAGHNGMVINDGQFVRDNGVVLRGYNYVTIQNLNVQNAADAGILITDVSAGVIIQNTSVHAGPGNLAYNNRGWDIRNTKGTNGVIVRNSTYTTSTSDTSQTDAVFTTNNNSVLLQNNNWIISNGHQGQNDGHNDCISGYWEINVTLIGNYCEHRNTKQYNAQGLYFSNVTTGGTIMMYNNVVVTPSQDGGIKIDNNDNAYNGRMVAYNNTVYGAGYGSVYISNAPNSIVQNNLLYSPIRGAVAVGIVGTAPPAANLDYNILYAPASSHVGYIAGSGNFTWSQWRSRGYEVHGLNANPQFLNLAGLNLHIQSTSPAINASTTVSTVTTDYAGTPRPQGSANDIGAYEFASGTTSTPTLSATTSASAKRQCLPSSLPP